MYRVQQCYRQTTDRHKANRGVATGVYRYIYPSPRKRKKEEISNRFVHVLDINTCFEIAMTS